ncbi:hypothetical protein O1M54_42875 [Streptomyces diastatochromogenes]|nr:hypothetical protein [Streptomyces diastatochromogenes]
MTRGNRGTKLRGLALAALRPGLVGHRHIERGGPGFVLLRPDGYVAASGTTSADWKHAERLLAENAA